MSRSKDAAYRESGEADYDEAGSPRDGACEKEPEAAEQQRPKLASVPRATFPRSPR